MPEGIIGSGVSLGGLGANQEDVVRFQTRIAAKESFNNFPVNLFNHATVQANTATCPVALTLSVRCQLGGATCTASGVSTPWLAAILSALLTLIAIVWRSRAILLGNEFSIVGLKSQYRSRNLAIYSMVILVLVLAAIFVTLLVLPLPHFNFDFIN